ncbi:MAG: MgtC/SapB family protein [Clostridiaceae bacterium]|nr:MgtC/SapB family protein [Clostridiaceae bacterium]
MVQLWDFQFNFGFLGIVIIRLLVACILGGIIGFEREYTRHTPAGFRTHILVSLGACLIMLISLFTLEAYGDKIDVDVTRIGAQVVSGIGFLGAGAIIRHGVSVRGLTTAASVWAVACIGLACGIGFYVGAVISTLLIWLVLMYLKIVKTKFHIKSKIIQIEADTDIMVPLNELFQDLKLDIKSIEVLKDNSGNKKILCQLERTGRVIDYAMLSSKIMELEGVLKVTI